MADFGSLLGASGLGGAIGAAIVRLELDTAKYQTELRAAQAQTTAGAQGMGKGLAQFGAVAKAGLAAAAIGIVAFGAKAVSAASDLGEAVNKSNVIFGRNAEEIEKWAETGARAFGLSKTEALEAAGGFGQMLQTAGLAVGASARMSQALVELGGDLASFNNEDPSEMLERLRSGLAGEAEPLRRFGVFISEARVKTEAYTSGIAKAGEELTEAQKIQARFNLILEDSSKAQGDFQRTADSLPNLLRTLKAEFINTAAAVGEDLLPFIQGLVSFITNYALPALERFVELLKIAADPETYTNIPIIGDFFHALGVGFDEAGKILESNFGPGSDKAAMLVPHSSEWIGHGINATGKNMAAFTVEIDENTQAFIEHQKEARKAAKEVQEFANMTGEELKEWRADTKESFRTAIFALEDLTTQSDITKRDVIQAFREIRRDAREFANAMEDLPRGKWVNEEFIKFISDQGPEWIIGFASLNKDKQKAIQEDWEESQRVFNRSIKGSFLDLNDTLDKLDRKTTAHTVKIKYEYEGFDPTKPGMSGSQQVR